MYRIYTTDGQMNHLENPADLPDPGKILKIEEPFIKANLHAPSEYIGAILKLCEEKLRTFYKLI